MSSGINLVIEEVPGVVVTEQTTTINVDSVVTQLTLEIAPPEEITIQISEGMQGPQGDPGVVEEYVHTQSSASTTWTVAHNLGRKPLVTVLSPGNVEIRGDVTHLTDNTLVISFNTALTGVVRCI